MEYKHTTTYLAVPITIGKLLQIWEERGKKDTCMAPNNYFIMKNGDEPSRLALCWDYIQNQPDETSIYLLQYKLNGNKYELRDSDYDYAIL